PELKRIPDRVAAMLKDEEESFIRMLDRGLRWFKEAADRSKLDGLDVIRGEDAFKLHDTYGLYIDITEQIAAEAGKTAERADYQRLMEEAKDITRQGSKKVNVSAIQGDLPATDDAPKYDGLAGKAKILAWVKDNLVGSSGELYPGDQVGLVLDMTNFYAEQGG